MKVQNFLGAVVGIFAVAAIILAMLADGTTVLDRWWPFTPPKPIVATSLVSTTAPALPPLAAGLIEITSPSPGELVAQRTTVMGRVGGAPREVWLVVHPVINNSCWFQQATVHDGAWRVSAQFGEPGQHRGAEYEIRAIADPVEPAPPEANPVRPCWPVAAAESGIVPGLVRK